MSAKPGNHATLAVYAATVPPLMVWAVTPVANKLAVATIDAATTGMLRSVLAGPVALLVALLMRLPFPASGSQRRLLVLSGVTSFAVWPTLLSIGLGLTAATHAALIIAMIPVFTGLIAAAVDRRLPGGPASRLPQPARLF
ncbi:MAG: EamA family transporter [Candidatus Rariloculaceae bacterium]